MPKRVLHLARQLLAERTPLATLQHRQLHKLQLLVSNAYERTAIYRCLMQRAGVRPGQIESLADIARLPIVTKNLLLEFREDERTIKTGRSQSCRRILTSGTSGVPFEFEIDARHDKWRKAQYLRPYVSNGRKPWHRIVRLSALPTNNGRFGSRWNPFSESVLSLSSSCETQIAELDARRPDQIQGYPSALRCLAFELLARNLSTPYIKKVFTDSELLTGDTRAMLRAAFNAPVIDIFGSFETDNIAYQCSHDSDYHVAIDSVIAESLTNNGSGYDQDGDLVVTVLENQVTPFIRYNLGDRVRLTDRRCSCGRTFPLMKIVAGRSDDLIRLADGSEKSPMAILYRLDTCSSFLREYQIAQVGSNRFVVKVVTPDELSTVERHKIERCIYQDLPDAEVEIERHSTIDRAQSAKLKTFVNEMGTTSGKYFGH